MTTGERIEKLAVERGLSLRKLAMLAGVPYNTVYSAVKRKSDRVDRKIVEKIAKALDVDIRCIISDEQFLRNYTEDVLFERYPEFDALDAVIHVVSQKLNFDGRTNLLNYALDLSRKPEYQKESIEAEEAHPCDQTRVSLKPAKSEWELLRNILSTDD